MKLFLVVRPKKNTLTAIHNDFSEFKLKHRIFEFEDESNLLIPIAILGDYSYDKLPLVKEAILQSIFDFRPISIFFERLKFLQKDKRLILLGAFHKNKALQEIRDRLAYYCSSEGVNKINENLIPYLTIASAKLPSKQQYLHLKKKIERMKLEFEVYIDTFELVSSVEGSTSQSYEVIHSFEAR